MSDLEKLVGELVAELALWRSLVTEGGVPRYTVTPGAALNSVVTSTDGLLRRCGHGLMNTQAILRDQGRR